MNVTRLYLLLSFFAGLFSASGQVSSQTLNIGLLIPDEQSLAPCHGAELAIEEANAGGGFSHKNFHLITKPVKGLWGTGSKRSVSLIFEDSVLAIIGSLDGRNAHLAEQVTTKTKVAFISTWATDMTLSYAFVPWFFRVIPDDRQQALALTKEIYHNEKTGKVALIGEDTYDARYAITTFLKIVKSQGLPLPRQVIIQSSAQYPDKYFLTGNIPEAEAYVLFGNPAFASSAIALLHQKHPEAPVFGTISLLDDRTATGKPYKFPSPLTTVSTNQRFSEKGITFRKKFQERFGYVPGPAAAYAYDGTKIIIEAVKKGGTDRDKIIETLQKIHYHGVTGEIHFDEKGNLSGIPDLMIVDNGSPVPLKSSR